MKKSHRRILKYLFWGGVVLGAAIIAFTPPPKPHHHEAQLVPVTQIPKMTELSGEERTETPVGTSVVVPVLPPSFETQSSKGLSRIAIVIDDVGLDMGGSRRAVALPSYVTLSYIPYSTRLSQQTKEARAAGHELLLHMPMEPVGSADPGPDALLLDLSKDEMRRRLDTALASFVGFDGMNNHMGSKFTANSEAMELVVGELQQRNLFFLDSRTSTQSVGAEIAEKHGLPTISRDVFLDDDMSPKAVRLQLEQVERLARRKGYVVAIGHPHAVTLQALEEWMPDAEKRGFKFVPLNSLVNPHKNP